MKKKQGKTKSIKRKKKRRLRKKTRNRIILGAAVVFLLLSLNMCMNSCTHSSDTSDKETTAEESSEKETTSDTTSKKTETKSEEAKEDSNKEESSTDTDEDWSKYNDSHKSTYVTLVEQAVDKYISGVNWPWSFDDFVIADYSDDYPGTVLCSVSSVEIDNVVEKQNIIVILTVTTDGEEYRIDSVCVGNNIYQDDGLLQNLLDKINNALSTDA